MNWRAEVYCFIFPRCRLNTDRIVLPYFHPSYGHLQPKISILIDLMDVEP